MQGNDVPVWFVGYGECMAFRIQQLKSVTHINKSDASTSWMIKSRRAFGFAVFDDELKVFA